MTPFLQEGDHNLIMSSFNKRSENTFIYRSKVMDSVMKVINSITNSDTSVFLIGQEGVGKKHLSKYIHERSRVALGPYVSVHCGSLSSTVFETEFFGYKGEDGLSKEGAISMADGGTLVLDEITKMPKHIIEDFKKFLKTGLVTPIGSERSIPVSIRIIYSSSSSESEIKSTFDKELLQLMKAVQVHLPNLEERKEDIPDLVRHFLNLKLVKLDETNVQKLSVSDKVINALKCYQWTHNVKELKNVCEHFQVVCTNGEVTLRDLPEKILDTDKFITKLDYHADLTLSDINRIYILNALKHYPSKKRAAKALGITVKTLYNRLHEYGVFDRYAVQAQD